MVVDRDVGALQQFVDFVARNEFVVTVALASPRNLQ